MRIFLSAMLLPLILFACRPEADRASSQVATIFAQDNRRPMPTNQFPFRAIGMLMIRNYKVCTGTLVSTDLVLTSAHCLVDNAATNVDQLTFHLGYSQKKQTAGSRITKIMLGTQFPLKNRAQDWALLQLSIPLGAQYGFLKVSAIGADKSRPFPVTLAGYSVDFLKQFNSPSVHYNCRVHFSYNRLLRHDCDSDSGTSGGPLLVYYPNGMVRLAGIHVTSARCDLMRDGASGRCPKGIAYQHDIANFGVSAESFYDKIARVQGGNNRP